MSSQSSLKLRRKRRNRIVKRFVIIITVMTFLFTLLELNIVFVFFQMFTLFNQVVNISASYYVIMQYRQPHSLSKKVEQISIIDYEQLNVSVTFHYCPTDPGCRVVIGEEENLIFRFSKGTFTGIIQHERRTQLVGKTSSKLI